MERWKSGRQVELIIFILIVQDTYPPKATTFLRHFFDKILQSNIDRLRQHSFVYYLLRDFDEERARKYAEKAMMPEHFCRLMDGIWYLDNLEFEVESHSRTLGYACERQTDNRQ